MKAVKISKIIWNLDELNPAERGKVKASLPTSKGFMANDDFSIVDNVASILKKKYGYDVINFSYSEIHLANSFDDLMRSVVPADEKMKDFFNIRGDLTKLGEMCYEKLVDVLYERQELEDRDTPYNEIPKNIDKVILSIEHLTDLVWGKNTLDEFKSALDDFCQEKKKKYFKKSELDKKLRADAKKSVKAGDLDDIESDENEDEYDD